MNSRKMMCEVYLEGVKIDFNTVVINEAIGQTPEATISFPVHAAVTSLLPKTICQIFVSEYNPDAKDASELYPMVEIFQGEFCKFSFSGEFDKRSINILCRGMTQNLNNASIIPIDTNFTSYVVEKATQLIQTEDASIPVKHNILSNVNVLSQLATFKPTPESPLLPSLMIGMVLEKYAKNTYFRSIYELFKMKQQLHYFDPPTDSKSSFLKMLTQISGSNLLAKAGLTITQTTPLSVFVNQLLAEIGFEMQELAAPTADGKRILIKPDTTFFEPIKCNTVYVNDIASLQYSRDYDSEPTRAIRSTPYHKLAATSATESLIMSVVVPANVVTAKAAEGDQTTLDILGFTYEERMRGVLMKAISPSTMANDYICAAAQDAGIITTDTVLAMKELYEELAKDSTASFKLTEQLTKKIGPEDKRYMVKNLEVALANMAWLHNRQENRVCNVSTPYNPYRLVGFTGVVLTNELPSIVGMLHSVSSTISADGNASQSLTYSHCMFYDQRIGHTTADITINQDLFTMTQPWYSDWTGENINTFYKDITGLDNKAFRYVNQRDTNDPTKVKKSTSVNAAIDDTLAVFQVQGNVGSYEKYMYEHTQRKLKLKVDSIALLKGRARELSKEKAGDPQAMPTEGSPFILERMQRVVDIFYNNGLDDRRFEAVKEAYDIKPPIGYKDK